MIIIVHYFNFKKIIVKTYENTSEPQPDIEVNNLGAKSRAGFNGALLITPYDKTIKPKLQSPINIGTIPLGQFIFLLSVTALMIKRKKAVATSLLSKKKNNLTKRISNFVQFFFPYLINKANFIG